MVKINTRWKTAEDFNILRGESVWTKVKYFWRKGWIEIPLIMASTGYLIVGLGMIGYAINYERNHDLTPKYYQTPRIYRPEDPRVQKIRYTSHFD